MVQVVEEIDGKATSFGSGTWPKCIVVLQMD
jgi:hypothetical protein